MNEPQVQACEKAFFRHLERGPAYCDIGIWFQERLQAPGQWHYSGSSWPTDSTRYRDADVVVVLHTDGSYEILRDTLGWSERIEATLRKSAVPPKRPPRVPSPSELWWQKEDRQRAEQREAIAVLHREIRAMLGDPS